MHARTSRWYAVVSLVPYRTKYGRDLSCVRVRVRVVVGFSRGHTRTKVRFTYYGLQRYTVTKIYVNACKE
jgi:hypothetical protein